MHLYIRYRNHYRLQDFSAAQIKSVTLQLQSVEIFSRFLSVVFFRGNFHFLYCGFALFTVRTQIIRQGFSWGRFVHIFFTSCSLS
jgi:hypothetical protein